MARTTVCTIKVRVQLADDYTGEIPLDIEEDLTFDLADGHIREGLTLEVLDVFADQIEGDAPLPDED